MRFLVVLSLLTLTACANDSGRNASNNSDTNEVQYTLPTPGPDTSQPNFGTVGNGGSVIELPDGVVMADSYYQAPTYKVPSFYFGRVEDFDKVFPGVRAEIDEITRLLNMRFAGVEAVRFDPEKFEIYLSNKFSGEHAMPVSEGQISSQVAYTFSFRSLSNDLTSEVIHNVVEISPEIKSWPVRIQALILMHEISHHHPRLGMAEHFHSLIAPMIEGAETLLKIRDRQLQARAEGRQDTLQAGEYEKIVLLDRALFYMLKGRVSQGDIEFLPISCDSAYSAPCPAMYERGPFPKLNVRIVDKKGGGVLSIPVDEEKIAKTLKMNSLLYWNRPILDQAASTPNVPRREDAKVQKVLSEYYDKNFAKFGDSYVSIDSYILFQRDKYPGQHPDVPRNGSQEEKDRFKKLNAEFLRGEAQWNAKAFDGLDRNVFESAFLVLSLDGSGCARNVFRDLSGSRPKDWNWNSKALDSIYNQPRPYGLICRGGTDNHIESRTMASDYLPPIYLKGRGNKLSLVSATGPLFVNGENSVIENSSLSAMKYKDGKNGNAIGIVIGSNVVVKGSVIAGAPLSQAATRDLYLFSRHDDKVEVLGDGFKAEGVLYSGRFEASIVLSTLTQIPAHRLGYVEVASYNKETDEYFAIEPWFLTDYAAGETCGNRWSYRRADFHDERRLDTVKRWVKSTVPCIVHLFQPLDNVVPAEALR